MIIFTSDIDYMRHDTSDTKIIFCSKHLKQESQDDTRTKSANESYVCHLKQISESSNAVPSAFSFLLSHWKVNIKFVHYLEL